MMAIRRSGMNFTLRPPAFGQMHITCPPNTTSADLVIELANDLQLKNNRYPKGTVWVNHEPIGVDPLVTQWTKLLQGGQNPTRDDVIDGLKEISLRLLTLAPLPTALTPPPPSPRTRGNTNLTHVKACLLESLSTHKTQLFTQDNSLLKVFGPSVWWIPKAIASVSDIGLQLIKWGHTTPQKMTHPEK